MVGDALFNQYYTEGTSAYVAGNYQEAAKQLQMAIDSDEEGKSERYYDALYYLGFAYFNAGDKQKADETFRNFSDRYPDSASIVAPYISGSSGSAQVDTSGSQGAASMDSISQTTDQAGSSASSAQSNIEVYSGSNQSSNIIAWTDPTTGQGYDMYGNPVYSSGTGNYSPQIAWTDPTTGQGYDAYGNPVYQ